MPARFASDYPARFRWNSQRIVAEALHRASYNLALQIKHGRRQREIEERLLPVAQGIQTAFLAIRSLLEYDGDFY